MDGFSVRGRGNIINVLAKIPKSVLEPAFDRDDIDLSMAENPLIRAEILKILKTSIETQVQAQVSQSGGKKK
jgi:hypothetical protein